MENLIVRNGTPEDLERVVNITLEAYREYAKDMASLDWDNMEASFRTVDRVAQQGELVVSEVANQLAGSVVYFPPGKEPSDIFPIDWAYIRLLGVPPEYRGQGIARALTLECLKRAVADEAENIGLHTNELMAVAGQMYERLGFVQDMELPPRFGLRYWRYVKLLAQLGSESDVEKVLKR